MAIGFSISTLSIEFALGHLFLGFISFFTFYSSFGALASLWEVTGAYYFAHPLKPEGYPI